MMEVASQWGVSRRTVERWLARYEAGGLDGLPNRSHRPQRCPHQRSAELEVMVLELRRSHRNWGARRLVLELVRKGVTPLPSESAAYRCLVRAGVIDPASAIGGRRCGAVGTRRADGTVAARRGGRFPARQRLSLGGGETFDSKRRLVMQALSDASSRSVKVAIATAWQRMDNNGVRDAADHPGVPVDVRLLLPEVWK